tara:strand:+ start:12014 stop:12205 length:192 start_codon:yes stop_codon:yes gene_type:complete
VADIDALRLTHEPAENVICCNVEERFSIQSDWGCMRDVDPDCLPGITLTSCNKTSMLGQPLGW